MQRIVFFVCCLFCVSFYFNQALILGGVIGVVVSPKPLRYRCTGHVPPNENYLGVVPLNKILPLERMILKPLNNEKQKIVLG